MIAFLYLFAAASTNLRSDVYVAPHENRHGKWWLKNCFGPPENCKGNLHLMGWNLKLFMASNV